MRPSLDIPAFNRKNFSRIVRAWKHKTRDDFIAAVHEDRLYSAFTTKPEKAQGAARFVAQVFGEREARPIETMCPDGDEPLMEWSGDVALAKARDGKSKLQNELPLDEHRAVLAADVNVYKNGKPSHKLWRVAQLNGGELPPNVWLQEKAQIVSIFAGKVPFEICWECAIACVDGSEAVASSRVSLVVQPLDPRVMRAALEQAEQNRLHLLSNTGFATIETILAEGHVTKVSIVPYVVGMTTRTVEEDKQWQQDYTVGDRALLALLAGDVITTVPNLVWSL